MTDTHALWILDKALVRFFFVEILKVPLSVRQDSVNVRLVFHCQLQCTTVHVSVSVQSQKWQLHEITSDNNHWLS